jgi:hypothetical protein
MPLNASRRDLLEVGGALATAGSTAGLSGCVGDLLGIGSDSQSAISTVGTWWPARTAIADLLEDLPGYYGVQYVSFDAVEAADDRVDGDLFQIVTFRFDDRFQGLGVDPEDVGFRLYSPLWDVLRWDHDPSDVVTTLVETGAERVGQYRDFTIVSEAAGGDAGHGDGHGDVGSTVFAFDGSFLIHTRHVPWQDGKAIEGVKRLIDVRAGDLERFADENETFSRLLEAAYDGDVLGVQRFDSLSDSSADPEYGLFAGLDWECSSGRFDGTRFRRQDLYRFSGTDAVDMDSIETYVDTLEDETEGLGHATETTVNRHGPLVEVRYTVRLESIIE